MKKTSKKEIENMEFEISFFEQLIKENPDYTEALIPLGDSYTKMGLYEKGLLIDLRLAKLLPYDPTVFYNLACSYSLLGKTDDSICALENAINLGYNDFEHMENDPDLENLRSDNRYQKIIAPKHKTK
jgi:tetratricopeptide (TPR) repeat protein